MLCCSSLLKAVMHTIAQKGSLNSESDIEATLKYLHCQLAQQFGAFQNRDSMIILTTRYRYIIQALSTKGSSNIALLGSGSTGLELHHRKKKNFRMKFIILILRFILPCKSECQPIFQNSFQIFKI